MTKNKGLCLVLILTCFFNIGFGLTIPLGEDFVGVRAFNDDDNVHLNMHISVYKHTYTYSITHIYIQLHRYICTHMYMYHK
jgi:hypothetical protein